jgi:hypothetical protein
VGISSDVSAMPQRRILLLDLYPSSTRPLILPYLYLGAFLDALGIEYVVHRCLDDGLGLLQEVERERISHVFINLIMGPVLGAVGPICRLLKAHFPRVQVWVGGVAVRHVRPLLEATAGIDHVSSSNPCQDPEAFVRELYWGGLLSELPAAPVRVAFGPEQPVPAVLLAPPPIGNGADPVCQSGLKLRLHS